MDEIMKKMWWRSESQFKKQMKKSKIRAAFSEVKKRFRLAESVMPKFETISMVSPVVYDTILISEAVVELLIERGAEAMAKIERDTTCKVQLFPYLNNMWKVTVNGPESCANAARQMFTEVISKSAHRQQSSGGGNSGGGGRGGENSGPYVQETLLIPGNKCGLIIGRNGDTVKSLQKNLGVKMLFVRESQQVSDASKRLEISGDAMKVANAKNTIYSLINCQDIDKNALSLAQGHVYRLMSIERKSGWVLLGNRGTGMKDLVEKSRCKTIFVVPDDDPKALIRMVRLEGTPNQVDKACRLIQELMSDMGYGNNPMPGFDGGYNQNQWNQPAATGYPQQQQQQGGQNWQQSYYGAGDQVEAQNPAAAYQNYGQSAAAQPQAQQQGAAAAQQDYSAQWIEYYRQMGMHDKAALVEQQAKAAQGGNAAPGSANAAAYGGGSYN